MFTFDWPWKPQPDYTRLLAALRRQGDPKNVRFLELFADDEIIFQALGVQPGPRRSSGTPGIPDREWVNWYLDRKTEFWHLLGYDAFWQDLWLPFPETRLSSEDTAALKRERRQWVDEKAGIITSWKDFDAYPWPKPEQANPYPLERVGQILPEGMAVIARAGGVLEEVMWLMGYETFAVALYDNPDLIAAMFARIEEIYLPLARTVVQMDHVMALWMGDDMGYRTATMIGEQHLRQYVFPITKKIAAIAHEAGKPFLLHSCGNLEKVMEDLIEDVEIDAKHSFEDVIMPVEQFSRRYGDRIAVIGGIDVDLLCTGSEADIRRRTREVLEACMPTRGYILGTGNSVANYIPLHSFVTMLDEGQRFNMTGRGGAGVRRKTSSQ